MFFTESTRITNIETTVFYWRGDFVNYLSNFSYFPIRKNPKVAGHDLNRSKLEILKVIAVGFRYVH